MIHRFVWGQPLLTTFIISISKKIKLWYFFVSLLSQWQVRLANVWQSRSNWNSMPCKLVSWALMLGGPGVSSYVRNGYWVLGGTKYNIRKLFPGRLTLLPQFSTRSLNLNKKSCCLSALGTVRGGRLQIHQRLISFVVNAHLGCTVSIGWSGLEANWIGARSTTGAALRNQGIPKLSSGLLYGQVWTCTGEMLSIDAKHTKTFSFLSALIWIKIVFIKSLISLKHNNEHR